MNHSLVNYVALGSMLGEGLRTVKYSTCPTRSGGQFHRHELDKGGEVFRSSLKIYFTVAFHHLSSLYLNCSYAIFKSHGRFKL